MSCSSDRIQPATKALADAGDWLRSASPAASIPAVSDPAWSKDLVREIAMDIGKEVAAHIETMYPAALLENGPSMLLSVRNCVFNEIFAALNTTDEPAIRARLRRRKALRRARKAAFKPTERSS